MEQIAVNFDKYSASFRRDLRITLDMARATEQVGCGCHAASLRYKNQIVSYGVNKRKTHPLQKRFADKVERIYLHAEIDAIVSFIQKFGSDLLKETELIVVRVTKDGQPALSKPCLGCQKAIRAFNIKNVYYT